MVTLRIPTGMQIVSAEAVHALEKKRPVYPSSHYGMSTELLPRPGCVCGACNLASLMNSRCDEELPAFLQPQAQ